MITTQPRRDDCTDMDPQRNGPAAAAILAADTGCGTLGILAFAGDASDSIGRLSDWLVAWFALNRLWRVRAVALAGSMSSWTCCRANSRRPIGRPAASASRSRR
jgi:hypothetical protein